MKIDDLGLSARAYNCLKRVGIDTVEQLQQMSNDDLLRIRNMGNQTVAEIRAKVTYKKTIADRIRSMSDEELCDAFFRLIYAFDPATWFCKGKKECAALMDADKEIPDEMCKACLLAKLRQPAEDPAPTMAAEEKQHSGLIEED